jgi:prepilin-type N-terminal cleavage/methylation domain-containing protein
MESRSRARAFTLIEAMMVVTIVGILALLATAGYRRWVHTAYLSEAQDMVANIRAAEESFRSENGGYVSVSNGLGPSYDYPTHPPGAFKTAWGGPCDSCIASTSWAALNVQPSAPVAFGYSLQAANAATTAGGAAIAIPTLTYRGAAMNLSAMTAPWYIVEADGDLDGNGVFTHVYGMSATNEIYVDNEGE